MIMFRKSITELETVSVDNWKNLMAGSMRTFVTDRRTDGQTDGADYIQGGPKKKEQI